MDYLKTLILNNFFQNPDNIREYALSLKYTKRNQDQYFEGIRTNNLKILNNGFYNDVCKKIIEIYFGKNINEFDANLFFHQTSEEDKLDSQWIDDKIHRDIESVVAGIVYLSPNAPIECGTRTYVNINNTFVPDIIMGNVYNRLIIYPAKSFHSASNFFGKVKNKDNRLVLLFFLNNINYC